LFKKFAAFLFTSNRAPRDSGARQVTRQQEDSSATRGKEFSMKKLLSLISALTASALTTLPMLVISAHCAAATARPAISHTWPAHVLSGYEVKVSGSHLDEANIIFNGSAIEPSLRSAHELRFVAPDNAPGNYLLVLQNDRGIASKTLHQGAVMDGVIATSDGSEHNCALLATGTVYCWGANSYGQLGNGTTRHSRIPVQVSGITNAIGITARDATSCAVLATGEVRCWGNFYSIGGSNTAYNALTPETMAGVSNAIEVSLGWGHACTLLNTGQVKCWGYNSNGQLGAGDYNPSAAPLLVASINNAVSISAAEERTCAVLASGAMKCWGIIAYNDDGFISSPLPVSISGIGNAKKVSLGNWTHGCALLASGAVTCWDLAHVGQPGTGLPAAVGGINNAVDVSASDDSSCAVLTDGKTKCWGRRWLGNGTHADSATPVTVSGIDKATSISIGDDSHANCVVDGGTVRCWGDNNNEQLVNQAIARSNAPVTISGFSTAIAVNSGYNSRCIVVADGTVACQPRYEAMRTISGVSNAAAVDAGFDHSCALTALGTVQCWGRNYYGQLGNGTRNDSGMPVTVAGITNAVILGAGEQHSCVLLVTGGIRCWGQNVHGQLGNGNNNSSLTPSAVSDISSAVAISAGERHSCAVLSAGVVRCWGENGAGQLGNGSTTHTNVPVAVSGLTNVVAVSAGRTHSCALIDSGAVSCWGNNTDGQLGNGSSVNSTIPVAVTGITTAVAIEVSDTYSCAVLSSGAARCWGSNRAGQLGNDSSAAVSRTPVAVKGVVDAAAISAGKDYNCAVLGNGELQCWGNNYYGQALLPAHYYSATPGLPVRLP
jgi:alpha-tubulin suppressor-like RCC1 family protein